LGRIDKKTAGVNNWNDVYLFSGWIEKNFVICCVHAENKSNSERLSQIVFKHDSTKLVEDIELSKIERDFSTSEKVFVVDSDSSAALARLVLVNAVYNRNQGAKNIQLNNISHGFSMTYEVNQTQVAASYVVNSESGELLKLAYIGLLAEDLSKAIDTFSCFTEGIDTSSNLGNTVVAVKFDGPQPRCAVVAEQNDGRFRLQVQVDDGKSRSFTLAPCESTPLFDVYDAGSRLAQGIWNNRRYPGDLTYLGEAGACSALENGWLLMPSKEFASTEHRHIVLPFSCFASSFSEGIESKAASELLLPIFLRDKSSRVSCDKSSIAESCVLSWRQLKQEKDLRKKWHAHPMGILFELAIDSLGH
jgi:hypothetical protein